jgi:hypothetical protein
MEDQQQRQQQRHARRTAGKEASTVEGEVQREPPWKAQQNNLGGSDAFEKGMHL